jgi:4-amino-4-deoxy-L-arabinose transferase-like glycosyltransferase
MTKRWAIPANIQRYRPFVTEVAISLGLFLLALWPRAYDLPRFVTADEAKWVYRSAQFLAAWLNGDYAATSVNLTPAVTTTWLGSLGLAFYYRVHQAAINLPFTGWLLSLPEFRAELSVLVATRWPMVIFTSLGVVVIYWLARRLFDPRLAVVGAAFIALDAHTISVSRILGHDAPVTVFMIVSILLLLLTVKRAGEHPFGYKQRGRGAEGISPSPPRPPAPLLLTMLSGIAASLACLSKAPAFFLIPFAGLVLATTALAGRFRWTQSIKLLLIWVVAAYLTFVVVWPAAWVEPVGRPWAVVENAFLSATDQKEAEAEGYWRVPDLGPVYYLVNGGFKLSPLVTIGVALAVISSFLKSQNTQQPPNNKAINNKFRHSLRSSLITRHASPLLWLTLFTLLFILFMTLGGKRSPRYILPVFPPLAFIAAYGWLRLWQVVRSKVTSQRTMCYAPRTTHHASRFTLPPLLILAALVTLLPYTPYYFTYYNPLLGGPYTAPALVKIGWGEGLDQVGRFLQRELSGSRVGTAYASTIAPYFTGDISSVTGDQLDYIVLYRKQVQSGEPSPQFIRYFEQNTPIFSVTLNGIHYADVYSGPAPQLAFDVEAGTDLSHPIGYRPLTPYGQIGRSLQVDVIWQVDESQPFAPPVVTLTLAADESPVVAKAEGRLSPLGDNLAFSRHRLDLAGALARGTYTLWVNNQPLGQIELRLFDPPPTLGEIRNVVFDEQIGLIGYHFTPTEDYISLNVAWQAEQARLPDYTVFVQFLNAATEERVAGIDTQPLKGEWPTSRWVRNEVVVDEYFVAMPPGLPPGVYKMVVGLYRPETGRRLLRANGQDYWSLPFTFIRE